MSVKRYEAGDTISFSWINCGVTPTSLVSYVKTGSETIISSESMISSGGGFYYNDYTLPDTPGFYVTGSIATINGKPYRNYEIIQVILVEVD